MTTAPDPTPTDPDDVPEVPMPDVPAGPQTTTPDEDPDREGDLVPDDSVPVEADPR